MGKAIFGYLYKTTASTILTQCRLICCSGSGCNARCENWRQRGQCAASRTGGQLPRCGHSRAADTSARGKSCMRAARGGKPVGNAPTIWGSIQRAEGPLGEGIDGQLHLLEAPTPTKSASFNRQWRQGCKPQGQNRERIRFARARPSEARGCRKFAES